MSYGIRFGTLLGLMFSVSPLLTGQELPIGFDGAHWIWHAPTVDESPNDYLASTRYFRTELSLPESPAMTSAEIIIACDNLFVLYINGRPVGESGTESQSWKRPRRFDLTGLLSPGRMVVAVQCFNTLPGPSGLLVKFQANLENGERLTLPSDGSWRSTDNEVENWEQADFDDQKWIQSLELTEYGGAPWKRLTVPKTAEPPALEVGAVHEVTAKFSATARSQTVLKQAPPGDFIWPEGLVFVGDDCSLYRPETNTGDSAYDSLSVTIFNPRKSRAFPEHDLPGPMKVGRTLMSLQPARPGVEARVLLDAGSGALGSPSVSFDGKWVYFSMVREGESFFHLYRIPSEGGTPTQLTDGPFFDIDPAELPDGRIVFASTRVGTFEEYHSPPARGLFVMNADGTGIHSITNTIIFDNEPEVLADGRILFIRSDNFFDRGKVETLLHATFPDGTSGYTEFGLDKGPEYGGRLRANYCGSPAPMPDGRVAYISNAGITLGRMGHSQRYLQHLPLEAGDVAALPDGRLICTVARKIMVKSKAAGKRKKVSDFLYDSISVLDVDSRPPLLTKLYDAPESPLHSPVYLGARPRPPVRPGLVAKSPERGEKATGVLFCQNAQFTKNTTAGWDRIRAIRVLAGKGLTTRSSHAYIVHAGNETIELGTVPLAPDGSFSIEVPADTPLALQAVDAEGRAELNEMSWIYVRPGETRSCVGCHQPRQTAPISSAPRAMALMTPPLKLLGNGQPHRFRGNNAAVTGLMELQFDRFREVAGINRHSETPDSATAVRDDVDSLIAVLQGDDAELKISAAHRLAIFRDPKAAPALADCLADARRELRVAATVALAACGTRDSVPPLIQALADADLLVARGAAVALENLTGHRESHSHATVNGNYDMEAEAWRTWFANTTWGAIEAALIRRVETGDREDVRHAAVALGHTGGSAALPALRHYIERMQSNNPYPAWMADGHTSDNARFNAYSDVNPRTLQAATRAVGYLGDTQAVPMLSGLLIEHGRPKTGNLFLAEAAVEALGRIATPEAETALIEAFARLGDYPDYTLWYGDHPALMSCHASPVHYFILEALDALGSTRADAILPNIIQSVPIDPDRALLLPNDDYETLVGRILRRHGGGVDVVETCLFLLGDPNAASSPKIKKALSTVIRCWAGHPGPENRAAQILSMVCRDQAYGPRVEAALLRYCSVETGIERVFNTGIPEVDALPLENWVSFYLARTLGNLADPRSVNTLLAALEGAPPEAASGRPDPLGPGVLFLHNGLTPCWRAATAWALGRIGDARAVPVLLDIVRDLDNATDTRHAAAVALGALADGATRETIRELATQYPERSTRLALMESARKPAGGVTGEKE
jgi:HEAT repeat protein